MISYITEQDIALVKRLNSIHYESLGMTNLVSQKEKNEFLNLRHRLRGLSDFFKAKYDNEYGKFDSENSTGNPVGRDGKLRRVWSGIFKGSTNKQYSAQVSFVINAKNECLDVGFYFGRASAFSLTKEDRETFESELNRIGVLLSREVEEDSDLRKRFYDLFELGFKAEIKDSIVSPEQWLDNARVNPTYSSVTISLYPNTFGYIDIENIDFYVSMVIPLLSIIPEKISGLSPHKKRRIYALSPEQRAKRAERLALIGLDGEKYIMKYEKKRLEDNGIFKNDYPCHKALISDNEGYDILSCGPEDEDIFIEVKTTTFPKNHKRSRTFFLSSREFEFYQKNKTHYKLYRVWDIYSDPSVDEIDLENVEIINDGFKVKINSL